MDGKRKQFRVSVVKQSKAILHYYPRLSRMTDGFQSLSELRRLTLKPDSYSYEVLDGYADTYEKKMLEKYAIIKAWQTLEERGQAVLFYNYLAKDAKNIMETAFLLSCSRHTVEVAKQKAMLAFAEEYKNGTIIKNLKEIYYYDKN